MKLGEYRTVSLIALIVYSAIAAVMFLLDVPVLIIALTIAGLMIAVAVVSRFVKRGGGPSDSGE